MMSDLSMRALYYVELPCPDGDKDAAKQEDVKANENYLNQNFTIIAKRIAEIEARLE